MSMGPALVSRRMLPLPLTSIPLLSLSAPLVMVMAPPETRTTLPPPLAVRSERALLVKEVVLAPPTRLISKLTPVTVRPSLSAINIPPPPLVAAKVATVVSMAFVPLPIPLLALRIKPAARISTSLSPLASPSLMLPPLA